MATWRKLILETDLTAHTDASDPHPVYALESTMGQPSGIATLDGSAKVTQDPARATSTATSSMIPIADGSGKLDTWISSRVTVGPMVRSALGASATGRFGYGISGNSQSVWVAPRAGKIIGLGWHHSSSHSAGTITIKGTVNGSAVITLTHVSGTSEIAGFSSGTGDTFSAGDTLQIEGVTDSSWNGTVGNLGAFMEIAYT